MKTKKSKHESGRFRRFVRANKAVSALEYAILVGVVAVAIVSALTAFSGNIKTAMDTIGADISGLTGGGSPNLG